MENQNAFVLNYQKNSDNEDDPLRTADVQRKSLIRMVSSCNKSLNNLNFCELLDKKLQEYSKTAFPNGRSIYDSAVQNLVSCQNQKSFKSNLDKIDISSYIKKFPCSQNNAFVCKQSESPSDVEFAEFINAFDKKACSTSTSRNFEQTKPYRPEIKYPERKPQIPAANFFKTAREELQIQSAKKNNANNYSAQPSTSTLAVGGQKRKLGARRNVNSKFVSPLLANQGSNEEIKSEEWPADQAIDERLKNVDPKMVESIKSEIMDCGPNIHWNDIAGLEYAKNTIQEVVVWPMLRPDIFTGLRRPPKGILLFGPPGTGKTLIGKCVASQSKSTFFSISASSLTSKWIGDSEKMVRALFCVARVHQPSVIFIDEIDSLLSQRNESEHESSRRIKTEFLVQLEGATTDNEERILVIGATNRPQELDEAARRRFVKRLYIPLPEYEARLQLVKRLISSERHCLNEEEFKKIAALSDGYSGADIRNLCAEASLGPIRSIDMRMIEKIQAGDVRPLKIEDFDKAFTRVRTSVSPKDLDQYIAWDKTYGCGGGM